MSDPQVSTVRDVSTPVGVSDAACNGWSPTAWGSVLAGVLRRGRLHAAAEQVVQLSAEPRPGSWAEVAAEFGFADHTHLTREFRRVLEGPPGARAAGLVRESETG